MGRSFLIFLMLCSAQISQANVLTDLWGQMVKAFDDTKEYVENQHRISQNFQSYQDDQFVIGTPARKGDYKGKYLRFKRTGNEIRLFVYDDPDKKAPGFRNEISDIGGGNTADTKEKDYVTKDRQFRNPGGRAYKVLCKDAAIGGYSKDDQECFRSLEKIVSDSYDGEEQKFAFYKLFGGDGTSSDPGLISIEQYTQYQNKGIELRDAQIKAARKAQRSIALDAVAKRAAERKRLAEEARKARENKRKEFKKAQRDQFFTDLDCKWSDKLDYGFGNSEKNRKWRKSVGDGNKAPQRRVFFTGQLKDKIKDSKVSYKDVRCTMADGKTPSSLTCIGKIQCTQGKQKMVSYIACPANPAKLDLKHECAEGDPVSKDCLKMVLGEEKLKFVGDLNSFEKELKSELSAQTAVFRLPQQGGQ